MNLAKKALLSIFWNSIGNYLGFLAGFLGQLFLIRLLVPEDFGVFALVSSVYEILSIFTAWCFSVAIIQMPEEEGLVDTAFILSVVQGLIIIIIGSIISICLGFYYPSQKVLPVIFFVLGLARALILIAYVYSAILEKKLEFKKLSIARTFTNISSVLITIMVAIYGFGVWSLVIRELLSGVISIIAFKQISHWKFGWKYSTVLAKRLIAFGNKMLVSRGLEAAFYRLDNFIVGIVGGITVLGYYSQARYLVDAVNAATIPAASSVALPVYSSVQNEESKLKEAYRIGNYFLIRILIPISLILSPD